MGYFPVFLDLKDKLVVIVGGGLEAARKVDLLVHEQARIHIFADDLIPSLLALVEGEYVHWFRRPPQAEDLAKAFLVVVTSGQKQVARQIFQEVNPAQRLVNSADDVPNSNFIFGSVTSSGPVQVAVATSGKSPAFGQHLRDRIGALLREERVGELVDFLGGWRPHVTQALGTHAQRSRFWHRLLESPLPQFIRSGEPQLATETFHQILNEERRTK